MVSITVHFSYISAERMSDKIPSDIQFQTQLSMPSGNIERVEGKLRIPFLFIMTTTPLVASITFKGYVVLDGSPDELEKIHKDIIQGSPPSYIFTATLHHTITEAILISREIGIPPPIPLPKFESKKHSPSGLTLETI